MNAVEMARTARLQQERLLEDARRMLAAGAKARADAESALAAAESAHGEALSKSAASRSDAKLLDAASRASVLVRHAMADHQKAVSNHESAVAALGEAERNAAEAARGAERAELEAKNADGSHERAMAEYNGAIVANVVSLLKNVAAMRARLAGDADVARANQALGGSAQVPDGTSAAGAFGEALVAAGGTVHGSTVNNVRWLFAPLSPNAPRGTSDAGVVLEICKLALPALDGTQGSGDALAKHARIWKNHRVWASAQAELAAIQVEEGKRHGALLLASNEQAMATRGRVIAEQARGRFRTAPQASPRQGAFDPRAQAEGEFDMNDTPDDVPRVG